MNHKRPFPRSEKNSHTNIGRGLYCLLAPSSPVAADVPVTVMEQAA